MSYSPANPIGAIDAIKPAMQSAHLDSEAVSDYGITVPSQFQVTAQQDVSAPGNPSFDADQLQGKLAALQNQHQFLSQRTGGSGTVVIPVQMDGKADGDLGQVVVNSFINEAREHDQRTKKMMDMAKQGDGMTLAKSLEIQTDMALRNNRMVLVQTLVKKAGQTFQDIVKAQ